MRAILTLSALACAAALAVAGPAAAHHSFAMFDSTKTLTLDATVVQFQFTNPHSWMEIDVNGPDGVKHWSLEMNNLVALRRFGWRQGTVKPGDKVKVVMHPIRDGAQAGQLISLTTPDGKIWGGQGPIRADGTAGAG